MSPPNLKHYDRLLAAQRDARADRRGIWNKLRGDFAEAHYHLGLSYHTKAKLSDDDKVLYRKALKEYNLYLKYLPKGPLAEKARQNIKVVEPRLR